MGAKGGVTAGAARWGDSVRSKAAAARAGNAAVLPPLLLVPPPPMEAESGERDAGRKGAGRVNGRSGDRNGEVVEVGEQIDVCWAATGLRDRGDEELKPSALVWP